MLIVEAGREPVKTVDDLPAVVQEKKDSEGLLLLVCSETGSRFVVAKD